MSRALRGGGRSLVVGVMAVIATLGCGADRRVRDATPEGFATVRIAVRPYITNAPLYVADGLGFFEAQSIDVEFVGLSTSPQGLPLLLKGDLDVLAAPVSPGFLHAMATEDQIRFVADKGWVDPEGCSFAALVGRPEAFETRAGRGTDGSIRMSLPRDAQLQFFVDRVLSHRFGMAIDDKAIEGVNIPNSAEVVAFADGSLDGALMTDPSMTAAVAMDGVEVLAGINDVLPGFQFSFLTYGPRLLREDPDLGRRFMIGYLQGVQAYREGKTPRNVAAVAAATGLAVENVEEACWMSVRENGIADMETISEYVEWYREQGWLDPDLDFGQMWNGSFVDYAYEAINTGATQEDE